MSQTYSAIKNKNQKHPKVHYQAYLYNSNEPRENISSSTPAELEAEQLEDSGPMRQEFRDLANGLNNY